MKRRLGLNSAVGVAAAACFALSVGACGSAPAGRSAVPATESSIEFEPNVATVATLAPVTTETSEVPMTAVPAEQVPSPTTAAPTPAEPPPPAVTVALRPGPIAEQLVGVEFIDDNVGPVSFLGPLALPSQSSRLGSFTFDDLGYGVSSYEFGPDRNVIVMTRLVDQPTFTYVIVAALDVVLTKRRADRSR